MLPIQLFESMYSLISFRYILYLCRETKNSYRVYGTTCFLFGLCKISFTFFRETQDEIAFWGLQLSQYIGIILAIAGIYLMQKRERRRRGEDDDERMQYLQY